MEGAGVKRQHLKEGWKDHTQPGKVAAETHVLRLTGDEEEAKRVGEMVTAWLAWR